MKRIIAIFLCLSTVFLLGGCGKEPEPAAEPAAPTELSSPTQEATQPIWYDNAYPSVVVTTRYSGYTESKLLANVFMQSEGLSLSVRSDGTVDYIYSLQPVKTTPSPFDRDSAYLLIRWGAFPYCTITPEGQISWQPTDYLEPISDATVAVSKEIHQSNGWQFSFFPSEETMFLLIQAQNQTSDGKQLPGYAYTALYCMKDGKLTQVPFQYDEKYWNFSPMEDGFLALYDVGRNAMVGTSYSVFDHFACDGTLLSSVTLEDIAPIRRCFGTGGSTLWCQGKDMVIYAVKIDTGEILTSFQWEEDQEIIQAAVCPDGEALYILSGETGKDWAKMQVLTEDGLEPMFQGIRYAIGDRANTVSYMAAANDGTIYAVIQQESNSELTSSILLQYKKTS